MALAVARPQWGQRLQVSDLAGGDAVRVVLLDVSQSMAAREGAVEQIERARTVAADYLRYRPGLAANLILAAARPQAVFDGPSTNFDALRDELARCRVLPAADGRQSGVGPGRPDVGARSASRRSPAAGVGRGERFPALHVGEGRFLAPARRHANPVRIHRPGPAAGEPGDSPGRGPRDRLARPAARNWRSRWATTRPPPAKITVEVAVGNSIWRLTGTVSARPPHHADRGDRHAPSPAGSRARRGWWASTMPWPPTTSAPSCCTSGRGPPMSC